MPGATPAFGMATLSVFKTRQMHAPSRHPYHLICVHLRSSVVSSPHEAGVTARRLRINESPRRIRQANPPGESATIWIRTAFLLDSPRDPHRMVLMKWRIAVPLMLIALGLLAAAPSKPAEEEQPAPAESQASGKIVYVITLHKTIDAGLVYSARRRVAK